MTEHKCEIIDGIEYKLFTDCQGVALQVKDVDSGGIVGMIGYPSMEKAQEAHSTVTAVAGQIAAGKSR